MLNYEIDSRLLDKYVPRGTVLDSFLGKTYVSLVGFRFCHTKLFGSLAIPFHSDFDEVNLRFYVRHREGDEDRRGVVFIAEIVPKKAIATIARFIYGENYKCMPMKHDISAEGLKKMVEYQWRDKGHWYRLTAKRWAFPNYRERVVWNNSLPNTIGAPYLLFLRFSRLPSIRALLSKSSFSEQRFLFLSVRGFLDYAGPSNPLAICVVAV